MIEALCLLFLFICVFVLIASGIISFAFFILEKIIEKIFFRF